MILTASESFGIILLYYLAKYLFKLLQKRLTYTTDNVKQNKTCRLATQTITN